MAVNCCVVPTGIEALEGLMAMDASDGCPTVRVVDAETDPEVAVIAALPVLALVASPFVPELLLIIATRADDELQLTTDVRS